jgi:hypothetical protein
VADTGGLADVDAGVPDATLPDTALPDAAAPDIVQPDIDQPDGGCISDEQCEPLVPLQLCQVARCENGLCVAAPAADGEVCDDPKVDPGPCAQEECAAAKCRLFQLDSGTPCGETDACLEDQCNASGVCVAIPVIDCNDDNPCTADSCHPETGCSHTPTQGEPCDDGQLCTTSDTCTAEGLCEGQAVDCGGTFCSGDTCNPETGECESSPPVGEFCDDGDACTSFDKCLADGTCVGTPKCAKPANPCHKAVCGEGGTCTTEPNVGQACNDGNVCTALDACGCAEGTECTLDAIGCIGQPIPYGRACETIADCGGFQNVKCAGNACTIACDSVAACPQAFPTQLGEASCDVDVAQSCSMTCLLGGGKTGTCVDGTCL